MDHTTFVHHTALKGACAAIAASLLLGASAFGSIISTFDADTEGWSKLPGSDANSSVIWVETGGNPDGYMLYNEVGAGFVDFVNAPAAFLGDLSAYYAGTLSFDIRTNTLSNPTNFSWQVELHGGGMTLGYQLSNPSPVNQWHHRNMVLTETAGWFNINTGLPPTQAEMLAVLSDVTALDLLTDYRNGPEQVSYDNVSVSATCTGDLTGSGTVGVPDLLVLLGAWGPNAGHPADLDGDDNVGVPDLLQLLGAWGNCP